MVRRGQSFHAILKLLSLFGSDDMMSQSSDRVNSLNSGLTIIWNYLTTWVRSRIAALANLRSYFPILMDANDEMSSSLIKNRLDRTRKEVGSRFSERSGKQMWTVQSFLRCTENGSTIVFADPVARVQQPPNARNFLLRSQRKRRVNIAWLKAGHVLNRGG